MSLQPIDLRHLGRPGLICTYLSLEGEPTLVDPGPSTTYPRLREALGEHGLTVRDLRHVLLTHVHMDHAGSTGHLVAENPRIAVHVHLDGLPHMADPSRLVSASRGIWGDALDVLWGAMQPVPTEALRPWVPGTGAPDPVKGFHPVATPGHIGHHVAWLHHDGTLHVGDALGVALSDAAPTHSKTPPPAVDLEKWRASLAELRGIGAERAAFTHFGVRQDVGGRIDQIESALGNLENLVLRALENDHTEADARAFREDARAALARRLPRDLVAAYIETFDPIADWQGVERYVRHQASTL